jgi:hypothetical protein
MEGGRRVLTGAIIEKVSWDREFRVLNEAIRRLNAEYDAFLFGSVVKPPAESRRHVEEMFRRLTTTPSESAAERYQLSSLQGRFSSLCERWERLQAEKEAGRRPGIHGGFMSPPAGVSPPRPNAPRPVSVEPDRGAGAGESALFERYVAARRARGEDVAGLKLEAFLDRLAQEREKLRDRLGSAEIEFDVVERDGRIKLIGRPRTGPKSKVQSPK